MKHEPLNDNNNHQKIIDRVMKLLRMADDASSPYEAVLAAKKARKLMDEHQLQMEDLREQDDFGFQQFDRQYKRTPVWMQVICSSVARWNDCIAKKKNDRLTFLGYNADAVVALSIYRYLVSTIERLAKQFFEEREIAYSKRLDIAFKDGAADTVCSRINQLMRERMTPGTGRDLVVMKISDVEDHFGEADYEKAAKKKWDADQWRAAYDGQKAGKKISLDAQIETKEQRAIA